MKSILIAKTEIHQIKGKYCLNDLHVASPEKDNRKKEPAQWLRHKQTKRLLDISRDANKHLQDDVIQVVHGGGHSGTYANRTIFLSYAMWLSPEFHSHEVSQYSRMW